MAIRHYGAVSIHRARIGSGSLGATPQIHWITSLGTLGVYTQDSSINITLQATSTSSESIVYSLINGALPPNVTLNNYTGVISGSVANSITPSLYTFTARAAISNNSIDGNFTIQELYDTPTWVTSTNLGSIVLVNYSTTIVPIQLNVTDSYSNAISFSLTSGALPANLSLSSSGLISGNITISAANTNYTFSVTTSNDLGGSSLKTFNYDVVYNEPVWQTPAGSLNTVNIDSTITPIQLLASQPGGSLTYSLTGGALPAGISLNSSGLLYGTVTEAMVSSTFTVSATDLIDVTVSRAFSLSVSDFGPSWISNGVVGSSLTYLTITPVQLQAYSPAGTVSYTITSGTLPAGLTLSSSGLIYGTLTSSATGDFDFTVSATDIYDVSTSHSLVYEVGFSGPVWNMSGNLSSSYMSATITPILIHAIDYNYSNITYAVVGGTLPPSLTLDPSGSLYGTLGIVTQNTEYTFTIAATDGYAQSINGTFDLTIEYDAPIWQTGSPLTSSYMGSTITPIILVATDHIGSAITYSVTSGTLPPSLTLDPSGSLYGTLDIETRNTIYTFAVTATNALGSNTVNTFEYTVLYDAPVWHTSAGLLGSTAENTSINPVHLNAVDPLGSSVTYSVADGSSLPPNLILDPAGTLYGQLSSVSATTTLTFSLVASNIYSGYATRGFEYIIQLVSPPPVWQTSSLLGGFNTGDAVYITLIATSDLPITYAVTSGSLPYGVSLNPNSGILSGSFDVDPGYYSITVTAYIDGGSASRVFRFTPGTIGNFMIGGANGFEAISPDGFNWTTFNAGLGTAEITTSYMTDSSYIIGNASGEIATSDSAILWSTPGMTASEYWTALTWNGSVFCAVSRGSYVATSPDGILWTQRTMPVNAFWNDIVWNGTVFCAIADGLNGSSYGANFVALSPDGINWSKQTFSVSALWTTVSWNGNQYCILDGGYDGNSIGMTSPDGFTWTERFLPVSGVWSSIDWNGSVFCAVDHGSNYPTNIAITSPDGITWTRQTMPASIYWDVIVWNGSIFCAVGNNNVSTYMYAAAISSDGVNWTRTTMPKAESWGGLSWNGSVFCAVTYNSSFSATSPDGINWTLGTLPVNTTWSTISWNGSVFCAISYNTYVATSPDGINWTLSNDNFSTDAVNAIAFDGTTYVAGGNGGIIANSTDGSSWTKHANSFGNANAVKGIAYNSNYNNFVAGGVNGKLETSYDEGVTWTTVNAGVGTATINTIVYENNLLMAGVSNGAIISSVDGVNWTIPGLPLSVTDWRGIFWNGSVFCVVGYGSTLSAISTDGIHWTLGTLPVNSYWCAVSWNGSVFCAVAGGDNAATTIAATSPDGINWTRQTLPVDQTWGSIVWNGNVFCAITIYGNNGWTSSISATSPDGVSWTKVTLPSKVYWMSLAWNGSIFCAVDYGNIVATSPDGMSWTKITLSLSVTWRQIIWTGFEFYVVGGYYTNYTASSPDGINWTYNVFPFGGYWCCVAWNGSVFSAVQYDSNQAAVSSDGVNWTLTTLPISSYWYYISWNGSVFCATSQNSNMTVISPDGVNWTTSNQVFNTTSVNAIAYGNNVWVAAGASGKIATSPDGVYWTQQTSTFGTSTINSITFNEDFGLFVAVGNSGKASTSYDGVNWSAVSSFGTTNLITVSSKVDVITALEWITPTGSLGSYSVGATITPVQLKAIETGNVITYAISSGTLPVGLTLSSSGLLYGTLTVEISNSTFTVSATDESDATVYNNFTFNVYDTGPTWISSGNLGTFGTYCTITPTHLSATSNIGSVYYSLTSGLLPTGLTLTSTGSIYGTLNSTTTGVISFNVSAYDIAGISSTQNLSYTIAYSGPIWNNTSNLGSTINGATITPIQISATDTNGTSITYSIISNNLSTGLSLSSSLLLTGTLGYVSSNSIFSVVLSATDGYAQSITGTFSYTILHTLPVWSTSSGNIGSFYAGATITPLQLTATETGSSIIYSLTNGELPVGLTLSSAGLISGTVGLIIQTATFEIGATDKYGTTVENNFNIVTYDNGPVWSSSGNVGSGDAYVSITPVYLVATSPIGSVTYTIGSGSLPASLTLDPSGILYGTITSSAGYYYFDVTATDILGITSDQTLSYSVATVPPIWSTISNLGSGYMDFTITPIQLVATSVDGSSVTYSLVGGTLPPSLTLSSSGLITGTLGYVAANTTYTVLIAATDIYTQSATRTFTYQISYDSPAWITSTNLGSGPMGSTLASIQISASDPSGISVYYSLAGGTLPPSFTLSSTGLISGTLASVTSNTSYYFTIAATNIDGGYTNRTFNYQITYDTPSWSSSSNLGSGVMTTTITPIVLSSTDTVPSSITYSLVGGTLPPSLSLTSSGSIYGTLGTVSTDTTYNFTISATNASGGYTTNSFYYNINYDAPVWSLTGLPTIAAGGLPTSANWDAVAWNGSIFCAVSNGIAAATSPDGIYWTQRTMPVSGYWISIAWNGSVFCAIVQNSTIAATSPDGVTWTQRSMPAASFCNGIAWNGSVFCVAGGYWTEYASVVATSPDGITWTQRSLPTPSYLNFIFSSGSKFYTSGGWYNGGINTIWSSPNGITWTQRTLPVYGSGWTGMASSGSLICMISGSNIYSPTNTVTSSDGVNWTQGALPVGGNWSCVAGNGSIFCAIMYSSNIAATSTDGINWTQRALPASLSWDSIIWNGSNFYALAVGSTISAFSPDGIKWSLTTSFGINALGSGYMTTTISPIQVSAIDSLAPSITYALTSGSLPPNLVINSTGLVSGSLGVVSTNTTYSFSLTATNNIGGTTPHGFTYVVKYDSPVWSTSSNLGSGFMGSTITPIQLTATDTLSGSITYAFIGGTLPLGLTISSSALISGTLGVVASNTSYGFTMTAANRIGVYATQTFTYTINYDSPTWTSSSNLGSGYMGATITPIQLSATDPLGGTITYSISGGH